MRTLLQSKTVKYVGGALIVAIAFSLMMPGWMDYSFRIGKVILMITIALSIALAAVMAARKLASLWRQRGKSVQPPQESALAAGEAGSQRSVQPPQESAPAAGEAGSESD